MQPCIAPLYCRQESFCHTARLMGKGRFAVSLFFCQQMIELFCLFFDCAIDSRPDGQITENKNNGKKQDRRYAPFQPIVDQISDQIDAVQNTAMNQNCYHQREALHLIDNIHASCNKCKDGQGEYAKTDLIYRQGVHTGLLLKNQIEYCQNHWSEATCNQTAAKKFPNMLFHIPSYLFLISAKQRLETYSR